jgi:mono/diheme cytochrome c family protein
MMRRFTRSPGLSVRAALFLGLWAFLLVVSLTFFQIPGLTPAEWQVVAWAEESRPMPHKSALRLYEKRCLRCHDEDGRGREMRRSLPDVPDFTKSRWQKAHSTADLVVGILEGKGTGMPAFGGKITEEEARDLAAYIRSLGPRPAKVTRVRAKVAATKTAPKLTEGDFEKRFRQLEEEFNRLRKQLQELDPKRKK